MTTSVIVGEWPPPVGRPRAVRQQVGEEILALFRLIATLAGGWRVTTAEAGSYA